MHTYNRTGEPITREVLMSVYVAYGFCVLGEQTVLRIPYCVLWVLSVSTLAYCVFRIPYPMVGCVAYCVLRVAYPYSVLWTRGRVCVLRIP